MCSGQCGTIAFDSTCPPIELRSGYEASESCYCSNKKTVLLNCGRNLYDGGMFSDHYRYHQNQYKHHGYIAEEDNVTSNFISDVPLDNDINSTLYRPFLCLAVKDGYNEIVHSKYNSQLTML